MKKLLCMPFLMALSCSLSVGTPTKSGNEPKLLEMYYNVEYTIQYQSGVIYVYEIEQSKGEKYWEINSEHFYYVYVDTPTYCNNAFFIYDNFYRLVEYKH